MTTLRTLLPLAALLLAAGCAYRTSIVMPEPVAYPAAGHVEVLSGPPSRPYVRLAELEVEGPAYARTEDILASMRERAGNAGADAIMDMQESSRPIGQRYLPCTGTFETEGGEKLLRGVAIRYMQ